MRSIGGFFAQNVVKAVENGQLSEVYGSIIKLGLMAGGTALLFMAVEVLIYYVFNRILKFAASNILDRIMRMESLQLHERHSGDLMAVVSQDVNRAVYGLLASPL